MSSETSHAERTSADASTQRRDVVDGLSAGWARVTPELASSELELSRRAARLYGMLEDVLLATLAPLGLTRAEFLVLSGLRSVGAPHQLRPTDLTARLLLSSGGTSNVLNRLTESGLVERERDDDDGRSSRVRLTEAGLGAAEASMTAWARAVADMYRAVAPETTRSASDALRDVLLALGDHEDPLTGASGIGSRSRRSRGRATGAGGAPGLGRRALGPDVAERRATVPRPGGRRDRPPAA
jgi:DNA-binding MarR family transcriptional regulator